LIVEEDHPVFGEKLRGSKRIGTPQEKQQEERGGGSHERSGARLPRGP
jgi:hypothetical protein